MRFTEEARSRKPLPDVIQTSESEDDEDFLIEGPSCSKRPKHISGDPPGKDPPLLTSAPDDAFKPGDYVQVLKGDYKNWFAVILYQDEDDLQWHINYYHKTSSGTIYWWFKEGDRDKVPSDHLKLAKDYSMDLRGHVIFK